MLNRSLQICITLIAFLSSNIASANLCTKSQFEKESEAKKELTFDDALRNVQTLSKGQIDFFENTIMIFEPNQSKQNPVTFSQALNDHFNDQPTEPTYNKNKLSPEQQQQLNENLRALQKDATILIVDPYYGETGLKESTYYPLYEEAKRIGLPGGVKHPSVTVYQRYQKELNARKYLINKEMNKHVGIGVTIGTLALFAPIEPTTAIACIAGGMCFLTRTLFRTAAKTEEAQNKSLNALVGEMTMRTFIEGNEGRERIVLIMPDYLKKELYESMSKKRASIEL